MGSLSNATVADTLAEVEVVYLDRGFSTWWNANKRHKENGDTAAMCGYFWVRGNDEAGPFRSRSAAIRDAYYRFVLQREAPMTGHQALTGVEPVRATRQRRHIRLVA